MNWCNPPNVNHMMWNPHCGSHVTVEIAEIHLWVSMLLDRFDIRRFFGPSMKRFSLFLLPVVWYPVRLRDPETNSETNSASHSRDSRYSVERCYSRCERRVQYGHKQLETRPSSLSLFQDGAPTARLWWRNLLKFSISRRWSCRSRIKII